MCLRRRLLLRGRRLFQRACARARNTTTPRAKLTPLAQNTHRFRKTRIISAKHASCTVGESDPDTLPRHEAFRRSLQQLGWIEGRNVRFDFGHLVTSSERVSLDRQRCQAPWENGYIESGWSPRPLVHIHSEQ
jgi:hypothetical protein